MAHAAAKAVLDRSSLRPSVFYRHYTKVVHNVTGKVDLADAGLCCNLLQRSLLPVLGLAAEQRRRRYSAVPGVFVSSPR
jgi:hypothetical protein